ncbi:OsmC family peroxiredoxin [bacterium]|nr:MAG: OsmC family peroxiredoxin [bacterium]
MKTHHYTTQITWTGNAGKGTTNYKSYERSHELSSAQKEIIQLSSDPAFRGDPTKYNPEELLVSAVSSCHMLWFLHLCAVQGVVVTAYADSPEGIMLEELDGSGYFSEIILKPKIEIENEEHRALLPAIHELAHSKCFIANSLTCKVSIL